MNSLEYLGTIGVGKGWLVSYHHMCRWNSGFFYKHPFLRNYDFYWRVEPDVSTPLLSPAQAELLSGPLFLRYRLRRLPLHAR